MEGSDTMTDQSTTYPARDEFGAQVSRAGIVGIFAALVLIYFWFGGMKFTQYEAKGLESFVGPSFVIGWMYDVFSLRGFSIFLGILEIAIGLLIAGRLVSPKLSVAGGLFSCGLFLTTISFMLTTEGVFAPEELTFPAISVMPGQFLLKDFGLLAASVLVVGESLSAIARQRGA
ncbi:YkgB family protein [Marinovum algicola]|uniref:YkgB family protein n=2 Tax=Roseobacteraceae TaxID=2854170 RepID=UPI0024BA7737|nr:DUF417 family protein [Marinovum algicola]